MLSDSRILFLAKKRAASDAERRTADYLAFEENLMRLTDRSVSDFGIPISQLLDEFPLASYQQICDRIPGGKSIKMLKRLALKNWLSQRNLRTFFVDLLRRHIREKFPSGWPDLPEKDLHFYFHQWNQDIPDLTHSAPHIEFGLKTLRYFSFLHLPSEGWLPNATDDEVLEQPFKLYWPNNLDSFDASGFNLDRAGTS